MRWPGGRVIRLSSNRLDTTIAAGSTRRDTGTATLRLNPPAAIGEDFCVPSGEEIVRQKMREPAGGVVR
jgi:hypothetical protein